MHWALFCNVEQLRSLFSSQGPSQFHLSLNVIENPFPRFTFSAVLGMNL
jgi:hypothetical protein